MRRLLRILRNLALMILLAVVVLAGVVAVNTWRQTSQQIAVAPLPKATVDIDAAAQRLAAAIRFQTISSTTAPDASADPFREMQAHIAASFPAFHAVAKRETINGLSLLYTWQGSDATAAPIALLAHQDVVPVAPGTEGDWQAPPFEGVVRDGFIWGRGAWDDKGNLYAMMEAAEQLVKDGFRPKRTIYFAFGHDEEVSGLNGAKAIAETLKSRGVRLDFVLDEGLLVTEGILKGLDKSAALIGVSEKGYLSLTLTARATPGHSSMPPRTTAIGTLSAALAKLEANRLPAGFRGPVAEMFGVLAPEMSGMNRIALSNLWLFKPLLVREFEKSGALEANIRTTTALTIFNAGNKDNVLPGVAEATINFRLLPGDTRDSVIAHVRRVIDDERIAVAALGGNDPPKVSPTSGASYRLIARTIREIFPDALVAPGLMIAATDSRHYESVSDNIFRFSPVRANAQDLTRFHGTNERISIDNYADMIRFYRRLMSSDM